MMNVVTTIALTGLLTAAPDSSQVRRFTEPKAEKLDIKNGAGRVKIVAADVSAISVEATVRGKDVKISRRRRGDALFLKTECPRMRFFSKCSVDYNVTVPRRGDITVKTGSGEVSLEGLEGRVELRTGSGDIAVSGAVSPRLEVRVGSGDVTLKGSSIDTVRFDQGSGELKAEGLKTRDLGGETSSGRIDVEIVGPPPERIDLDTGSGNVRIQVPAGRYAVTTKTGSGDVQMDRIQLDRKADNKIRIDTGSGDVELLGRSAPDSDHGKDDI